MILIDIFHCRYMELDQVNKGTFLVPNSNLTGFEEKSEDLG